MDLFKLYQAERTFMLRPGRTAFAGEILRSPGDLDDKEAAQLLAMRRISPATPPAQSAPATPPVRKTLSTYGGGGGLVGGRTSTKPSMADTPAEGPATPD